MKKLAILLSLVMVLGLAVSASAAVDFTGYVQYGFEKVGEKEFFGSFDAMPDWRLQAKATVNDKLSATLRLDDKVVATGFATKEDKTTDYQKLTTADSISVDRAFFTYNAGAFTVNAGKIAVGGAGNYFSNSMSGVGASVKVPFSAGSVTAMVKPTADDFDFALTGDVKVVEGVKVYADVTNANDVTKYALEGEYAYNDFTFYGEVAETDDTKDGFEGKVVGVSTTVANFDLCGEYDLAAETFYVNGETTVNGVLYGAEYTSAPENGDATIAGYAKVSF